MKNRKEFTVTAMITVMLVLVTAFCISGTVMGQSKGNRRAEGQYYHAAEQTYVQEIRKLLEERGYSNSGVTMNRVTKEDGSRQYTVTIYHRRINKLSDARQRELLAECRSVDFPAENCNFYHEFLKTDL